MDKMTFMTLLPKFAIAVFIFAYGACIGSLVNVLVYRLPRGLGVVTPPSRCPTCNHKLTWRENIPIFGWILLRGKCRFCQCRISPEYPIVETFTGFLFLVPYLLFFGLPEVEFLHLGTSVLQPEWAMNGLVRVWPELLVVCVLLGSLVAMTLIDARTAQIPLVLVWTPTLVALVTYTAHAAWIQIQHGNPATIAPGIGWRLEDQTIWHTATGAIWAIPTPGLTNWRMLGAGIGGATGLGLSIALLAFGVIGRSFADYEEWEAQAIAEAKRHASDLTTQQENKLAGDPGSSLDPPDSVDAEPDREPSADDAELWIQYPYARREMFKELVFLTPAITLCIVGMWLAPKIIEWTAGPATFDALTLQMVPAMEIPLWLSVLGGVLLGYLIGGGVVWAVRILGSFAFGKEALGLGDVHLVAAIGASLGWIDAVFGFFGAAFVGLAWTLLGALFTGKLGRTLPYGPYIAIATVLVYFGKPGVEWFLGRLLNTPINLP